MSQSAPIVEFTDATIVNGESPVVFGLNMSVCPGDFVYIIGKVGSGKTSIIRTIIAENPLTKGTGTVCGFDLKTIKDKEIPMLRRRMGIVFQDFQLLMDRNVRSNLEFVLKSTGWKDRAAIAGRIDKVLADVGMEDKKYKMPYKLSGGEQQRIAIARALLNDPEVIIADEPTGNLDKDTADGIMKLLRRINGEENGTAVIMVTHNNAIVDSYPGRVFVCGGEKCTEQHIEG
ncbi:MAG: ATP-binding cassette domain-containing protein [Bacteroidales bacterium]|nr:ATP-binding cassette domain-containing protein [Candidatus Hennigimonas equi]